jgi:hypothetical protein
MRAGSTRRDGVCPIDRNALHAALLFLPTRRAFAYPDSPIVETAAHRVLVRLRTQNDDFRTYKGYRRYAEIVAVRAPNAQDARIFAT